MSITPSPEQAAVLDAVAQTSDNLLISACAGGAKSTTLRLIASAVGPGKSIVFLAFNTAIAEHAQQTFPYYVRCCTFNSFCNDALGRHLGYRPKVDAGKVRGQLKALCPSWSTRSEIQDEVLQLVSFAKSSGYACDGVRVELSEIAEALGTSNMAHGHALQILETSIADPRPTTIDFDDQLWLTLRLRAKLPSPHLVLLDEAQDTNGVQRELLKGILGYGTWKSVTKSFLAGNIKPNPSASSRLIAVGDSHQSIYAFRGASHDAMDALRETFAMRELGLSVSWRCAKAVVTEAQKYL